jgi:hypothetical protein
VPGDKISRMGAHAIELMDGPLKGYIHELDPNWPMPHQFGRTDENDRTQVHWYRIDGDKAYFVVTEANSFPPANPPADG